MASRARSRSKNITPSSDSDPHLIRRSARQAERQEHRETLEQEQDEDKEQHGPYPNNHQKRQRQRRRKRYREEEGDEHEHEQDRPQPQQMTASSYEMPPPASPVKRRAGQQTELPDKKLPPKSGLLIPRRGTRRDDRQVSLPSVTTNPSYLDDESHVGTHYGTQYSENQPPPTIEGSITETHRQLHSSGVGHVGLGPAYVPIYAGTTQATEPEAGDDPIKRASHIRLMKSFLPRLKDAADDLQRHLAARRDETWSHELEGFRYFLHLYRKHYVKNHLPLYIDIDHALTTMGLDGPSLASLEAGRILSAANLVTLLDDISALTTLPDIALEKLQVWDMNFPAAFQPYAADGSRVMDGTVFDVALQIRTECSIETLRRHSGNNISLFAYIAAVFCGIESVQSAAEMTSLLDREDGVSPFKTFVSLDLDDRLQEIFHQRCSAQVKNICAMLSDDDPESSLARLAISFPRSAFLENVRSWAQATYDSTKDLIDGVPPRARSPGLFVGDNESQAAGQLQPQPQSVGRVQSHNPFGEVVVHYPIVRANPAANDVSLFDLPNSIQALRDLDQSVPAQGTPPSAQQAQPVQPGNSIDDDLVVQQLMRISEQQQPSSSKRPNVEPDEFDEFETDHRVPARGRRNKKRPQKRVIAIPPTPTPPVDGPGPSHSESLVPPEPMGGDGVEDGYPGPVYTEPDLITLSQRSREVSVAARGPREPQRRVAWTRQDTRTLITAIHVYRAGWSLIAKEIQKGTIPFEIKRDQQALRDKARLLKQDFLKTDSLLPADFDLVPLGKKEREAVISCGKNPDRKEYDVDAEGQPINTEYQDPNSIFSEGV